MNESTKPSDSSNRLGKNQQSYPKIHINKKRSPLEVMRKNMNNSIDADRYHAKTFRKFGQIGKQTQQKKPMMSRVVKTWLNDLSPS